MLQHAIPVALKAAAGHARVPRGAARRAGAACKEVVLGAWRREHVADRATTASTSARGVMVTIKDGAWLAAAK